MNIIKTNNTGACPPIQTWNHEEIPDGYAVWPDTVDTADFYTYNGFVSLTVETVEDVPTVTGYTPNTEAWEAWKATLTPEPEPIPTIEERVDTLETDTAELHEALNMILTGVTE